MKITVIYGASDMLDYNLSLVTRVVYDTFLEIGEYIDEIKLSERNISQLNSLSPSIDTANIFNTISDSDGIIFACTSHMFAPCGLMQNFLDYFSLPIYKNILKDKNCYIITVSDTSGEKQCLDYMSRVVQYLGGYPSVTTAINSAITSTITTNQEYKSILEKQIEDYYRMVRQNRKFFIPTDSLITTKKSASLNIQNKINATVEPKEQAYQQPYQQPQAPSQAQQQFTNQQQQFSEQIQPQQQSNTFNDDAFTAQQDQDIRNIAKMLYSQQDEPQQRQQQYKNPYLQQQTYQQQSQQSQQPTQPTNEVFITAQKADKFLQQPLNQQPVEPRNKTVKQLTQSLEHYYQPHLANDLVTNIQLNISGDEQFDGVIKINGNECSYADGIINSPDVTIISSAKVWRDVLIGTISSQKAFMTGQLKVRGNFLILAEFEKLFKLK